MTRREPPPLADFLLKRFVTGDRGESLLGDLHEEYQTGRTPGWYWRETLAALLVFARREVREVLSRGAVQLLLALTAQAALLVWLVVLSEQHRQRCPAPPVLLSGSITLLTCAGLAQVAISLVLWLSSLRHSIRAIRRPGLVRLSVVAFAAVGFSGGAFTWASTALCATGPLVCPRSSVMTVCASRADTIPARQQQAAQAARLDARSPLH